MPVRKSRRAPKSDTHLDVSARQRDQFWSHVDRSDPSCCWPWLGYINPEGYGQASITVDGKRHRLAHRIAYMLEVGAIPAGCEIDHTCHKAVSCADEICPHRSCVMNPAHLEAVTHSVNVQRASRYYRGAA